MDVTIAERLMEGLAAGLQPDAVLFVALGLLIGIFVGALPGIGPTVGMALLLPVTIRMTPENAVFLLASVNMGAAYGNSIPAILVGVPGSPSALLTAYEGRFFRERGEAGRALLIVLLASVTANFFGVIMFIAFAIPVAEIAVRLLFPEVFAVMVFGIVAATGLISRSPLKGFIAIMLGLLLALPGQDAITGQLRYTFGQGHLETGLETIPVVVGLLAFREVFIGAEKGVAAEWTSRVVLKARYWLSAADWKDIAVPIVSGTLVGFTIGVVPGAGGAVGAFLAYQVLKMIRPRRGDFGKGSAGGLATIDAAGNADSAGELIPTLALGIPGSSSMVVLMAALAAQGLFPGPYLLQSSPGLLYAVFGAMLVGVVLLAVLGYLLIRPSVYIGSLSPQTTMAATMILVVTGAYALRWSLFDVWVAVIAGIVGYLMRRFDYPVAPAALAFILGPMLETNLRRGLIMTGGWTEFLSRPITATLLILAALTFVLGILMNRRAARLSTGPQEAAI